MNILDSRVFDRSDPDQLRDAWESLRRADPHVHGPDAAARLGVAEAHLLACKVGHGAVALEPDLRQLLSTCQSWGKLLVAIRSASGVMLNVMETVSASYDAGAKLIRISGPAHDIAFADAVARSCFLLEDHDAHGHTVSVNWFDGRGDAIGRIFLMAKTGRERALPGIHRLSLRTQSKLLETDAAAEPAPIVRTGPASNRDPEGESGDIAAAVVHAVLSLPSARLAVVAFEGAGAACCHSGQFGKASQGGPAVHASGAGAKLHLRPSNFRTALRRSIDNNSAFEWRFVDRIGGELRVSPITADATPAQPVESKGTP